MVIKSNKGFPELDDDEFVFIFDKLIPLKNQILYEDNNHYLLNVLKIYTNDIYFGVQFSCLLKNSKKIIHLFRCKDREFPELLVDDKEQFLNLYVDRRLAFDAVGTEKIIYDLIEKPQNFLKDYNLSFVYDKDGNYIHSTVTIKGAVIRGIYGSKTVDEYEDMLKGHPFSVLNREPTEDEIKKHLIDEAVSSLSNTITRENTAYSNIKVYHKTEI